MKGTGGGGGEPRPSAPQMRDHRLPCDCDDIGRMTTPTMTANTASSTMRMNTVSGRLPSVSPPSFMAQPPDTVAT